MTNQVGEASLLSRAFGLKPGRQSSGTDKKRNGEMGKGCTIHYVKFCLTAFVVTSVLASCGVEAFQPVLFSAHPAALFPILPSIQRHWYLQCLSLFCRTGFWVLSLFLFLIVLPSPLALSRKRKLKFK